jgi:hypothetical protein
MFVISDNPTCQAFKKKAGPSFIPTPPHTHDNKKTNAFQWAIYQSLRVMQAENDLAAKLVLR